MQGAVVGQQHAMHPRWRGAGSSNMARPSTAMRRDQQENVRPEATLTCQYDHTHVWQGGPNRGVSLADVGERFPPSSRRARARVAAARHRQERARRANARRSHPHKQATIKVAHPVARRQNRRELDSKTERAAKAQQSRREIWRRDRRVMSADQQDNGKTPPSGTGTD